MKFYLFSAVLFHMTFRCLAQDKETIIPPSVKQVRLTDTTGGQITLSYRLEGNSNQLYEIRLYSNQNKTPLQQVTGDVTTEVGSERKLISPGPDKQIRWNAREEMNGSKRGLKLRVEATLVINPLQIDTLANSYKRGSKVMLKWKGGILNDSLGIVLVGTKINTTDLTNRNKWTDTTLNLALKEDQVKFLSKKHQFTIQIPDNIPQGKNYQIKITSHKAPQNATLSNSFTIKRRIPLGLKLLIVPLAAGGVLLLLPKKAEDGEIPPPPADPNK